MALEVPRDAAALPVVDSAIVGVCTTVVGPSADTPPQAAVDAMDSTVAAREIARTNTRNRSGGIGDRRIRTARRGDNLPTSREHTVTSHAIAHLITKNIHVYPEPHAE